MNKLSVKLFLQMPIVACSNFRLLRLPLKVIERRLLQNEFGPVTSNSKESNMVEISQRHIYGHTGNLFLDSKVLTV